MQAMHTESINISYLVTHVLLIMCQISSNSSSVIKI
jgi:hypothetical protein